MGGGGLSLLRLRGATDIHLSPTPAFMVQHHRHEVRKDLARTIVDLNLDDLE